MGYIIRIVASQDTPPSKTVIGLWVEIVGSKEVLVKNIGPSKEEVVQA